MASQKIYGKVLKDFFFNIFEEVTDNWKIFEKGDASFPLNKESDMNTLVDS